jgi:hypothetical protein
MGLGRGGVGSDCREGCLIARWFAGAWVVGRWLCIAIFFWGGAKGFYRVGLCVWDVTDIPQVAIHFP